MFGISAFAQLPLATVNYNVANHVVGTPLVITAGTADARTQSVLLVEGTGVNIQAGIVQAQVSITIALVGVGLVVSTGDALVWADVSFIEGTDWHDVIQTTIMLGSSGAFAAAPMGSVPIAGDLPFVFDTEPGDWQLADVGGNSTWRNVVN